MKYQKKPVVVKAERRAMTNEEAQATLELVKLHFRPDNPVVRAVRRLARDFQEARRKNAEFRRLVGTLKA